MNIETKTENKDNLSDKIKRMPLGEKLKTAFYIFAVFSILMFIGTFSVSTSNIFFGLFTYTSVAISVWWFWMAFISGAISAVIALKDKLNTIL